METAKEKEEQTSVVDEHVLEGEFEPALEAEAAEAEQADDKAAVPQELDLDNVEGLSVKMLTDLQREIESLRRERTEQDEQMLRTQAEMQNLRRRVDRDIENAHKFALEKFVAQLLPVADSLEQGLRNVPEDDPAQQAVREGLVLTNKMFSDALEKFSVEAINPMDGVFDPQFHEAVTMVPQPEIAPNTVINVIQKGYLLSGRLVRPALVVVAKAP